ncbi:glutathione S-transferase-like isoform X1 [Temnothorax nylanderi]|uniref:glutathione S-transferase-like isoform X1 n=2 Tax=Temnothorax nylanderi TaxID=102681 RepID=UPI003A83A757
MCIAYCNMPTYKLTYFNATGLGESIRYLLSHYGIKFEDVRVDFDDWTTYKPNMPMRQIPVLEIDGKQYHQSRAIGRFLAKKGNLYGSDDFEAMEIDAAVDSMDDCRLPLTLYYWEQDPDFKEKLKETAFEKWSLFLDKFEDQVKKNGGYFVNGKLSWADFVWTGYCDYLSFILGGDPNKDHPALKKLVDKVRALPKIKAYIEKRPKTQL